MMQKRKTLRTKASGCYKHDHPCTCAMGHLSRFVEPVVLLILKQKRHSHGYDISAELAQYVFTDADIERGALYRTLRRLERFGYVKSGWKIGTTGPARRVYSLTAKGNDHLTQWARVLENVAGSMYRFLHRVAELEESDAKPKRAR